MVSMIRLWALIIAAATLKKVLTLGNVLYIVRHIHNLSESHTAHTRAPRS
jgi:hypothetical protein